MWKRISQKKIQLTKSLHLNYKGIKVTLPRGFTTDGASIPWFLWWFGRPFDEDTLLASYTHDYLYNRTEMPRLIADLIFLDMMKENKTKFIKRWIYFIAVLFIGWVPRKFKVTSRTIKG
jgi:hypothetical protein